MPNLREWKDSLHRWGKGLNLIRRVHDVAIYWGSGEVKKDLFPARALRALVLAPHPDDETIGCGGTAKLIVQAGGQVDAVYFTRGEMGRSAQGQYGNESSESFALRREAEARLACQRLGFTGVSFLGGRDGALRRSKPLAQELARKIDSGEYDLVFAPWPFDAHPDHQNGYRIFKDALHWCCSQPPSVWLYEVWSPLHANRIVNIDGAMATKLEALRCHSTQLQDNDLVAKITSLANYRSIHLPEAAYCEAFLEVDSKDLGLLP